MLLLPSSEPEVEPRFMAFMIDDKVGLTMLPVTGNPFQALALIAHPQGVSNIACTPDGKYLFTAGGNDCSVALWKINPTVLVAQHRLGGEGLLPFFSLIDGGRDGELFHEMEDYFYYAQLKCQGINVQETREVSETIPLSEIPSVMRALGYYPTEQEVEEMTNEVKFEHYVETGEYVTGIDLSSFLRLYVNHRPPFGLQPGLLKWAFDVLGNDEGAIERGDLLRMLQTRGEKLTEEEIAEHLSTLLGYNTEGGSCEESSLADEEVAGEIIEKRLPTVITANIFADSLLGLGSYALEAPGLSTEVTANTLPSSA
jgi:Ca2+-binding EF-hand superfamily protein